MPYHLAIALQDQGKVAEARAAFTRFIALAPARYERQLTEAKRRLAALAPEGGPR